MRRFWLAAVLIFWAATGTAFASTEQIKGRLIGETCAKKGKVGDCYLKWAYPMVLFTEEGDYYQIDLLGDGLDRVSLDKAFGQEVAMEGEISGQTIKVRKMTLLNPPGKKVLFKS